MDLKKRLLHFVACLLYPLPDKQMLQLEYPIKMGRTLNMPSRGGKVVSCLEKLHSILAVDSTISLQIVSTLNWGVIGR